VFLLQIKARTVHIILLAQPVSQKLKAVCPWSIFAQTLPCVADLTMIFIWFLFYNTAGKNAPAQKEYIHMDPDPKNMHILGVIRKRNLISWGF